MGDYGACTVFGCPSVGFERIPEAVGSHVKEREANIGLRPAPVRDDSPIGTEAESEIASPLERPADEFSLLNQVANHEKEDRFVRRDSPGLVVL